MDHNIYLLMSHRYLQGLLVLLDIQKIKNNSVCYLSIMTYWLVMLGFVYCVPCMYWDLQCEILSFVSLIGRAIIFTFLHFLFSQCKSESAWKVFLFTHRVALKNLTSFATLTHSFFFWCMATCEWKLFVHTFHDIIYVSLKSKWFDLRVEIIEMSVICTDKSASWDISYLDDQSACTWSTADAIVVIVRKRGSS